tara:strand:- start:43740 stop:44618 length:879 start_codon:yes stop_codon:yes gene_type:complete
MSISASMVKELRERTGAGMMECKKALVDSDGNLDSAIELLRTTGQAKAEKKAKRIAAEGRIIIKSDTEHTVILEINSETDFVANDSNFINYAESVAVAILENDIVDLESLSKIDLTTGTNVEMARTQLISKIGENISIRRFDKIKQCDNMGIYTHGARIGVVVSLTGGDEVTSKDVAMHVAASNPICINNEGVPEELVSREERIFQEQAASSGKPPEIIDKMIQGRMKKFFKEVTLMGQPFIKNPDMSVNELLKESKAEIISFKRYEVGEGIEKKEENFADEVMAQIKGNES